MLTGVSFLRERAEGTLERLLTTTVGRTHILGGYFLAFLVFAIIQTFVILAFTILVLQISYKGNLYDIVALLMLWVIVPVSLGIFISTFARNEFQVIQFIPVIFAPQLFLSGVIIPVKQMPLILEWISNVLPLTYAVEGLQRIMINGDSILDVWLELAVISGFGAVLLIASAATLRRTR